MIVLHAPSLREVERRAWRWRPFRHAGVVFDDFFPRWRLVVLPDLVAPLTICETCVRRTVGAAYRAADLAMNAMEARSTL